MSQRKMKYVITPFVVDEHDNVVHTFDWQGHVTGPHRDWLTEVVHADRCARQDVEAMRAAVRDTQHESPKKS